MRNFKIIKKKKTRLKKTYPLSTWKASKKDLLTKNIIIWAFIKNHRFIVCYNILWLYYLVWLLFSSFNILEMGNSFASDKLVRKKSINLKNEANLIFNFSVQLDADIFQIEHLWVSDSMANKDNPFVHVYISFLHSTT